MSLTREISNSDGVYNGNTNPPVQALNGLRGFGLRWWQVFAVFLGFVKETTAHPTQFETLLQHPTTGEILWRFGLFVLFLPCLQYAYRQTEYAYRQTGKSERDMLGALLGLLALTSSSAIPDSSGGVEIKVLPIFFGTAGILILLDRRPSPSDGCECGRAECNGGCGSGPSSGGDDSAQCRYTSPSDEHDNRDDAKLCPKGDGIGRTNPNDEDDRSRTKCSGSWDDAGPFFRSNNGVERGYTNHGDGCDCGQAGCGGNCGTGPSSGGDDRIERV